jgi:hypothetical protein
LQLCLQVVNVMPGGYLEDNAQLELVVQHAVAACAADDLRPALVSNVQLVSAQGLELSHPHLLSSVPAGGVTEHTYVLSYQLAADCALVTPQMEECALSEKIALVAEQHAAGNLVRALAAEPDVNTFVSQPAPAELGHSQYAASGPVAGVLAGLLLLAFGTVWALRNCGANKQPAAPEGSPMRPSSVSCRC